MANYKYQSVNDLVDRMEHVYDIEDVNQAYYTALNVAIDWIKERTDERIPEDGKKRFIMLFSNVMCQMGPEE